MVKAKKNVKDDVVRKKVLLGKPVMFIGLLGAQKECSYCGAKKTKGMFREYLKKLYCSEDCIKMGEMVNSGAKES